MTYTPLKHIVFVPGPPWGHLRPGLKTSLRLVEKFQDIFISLFVYHSEVPKAVKYLNAQPSAHSRRIRVVTATNSEEDPSMSSGNEVEVINCLEKSFGLWMAREHQQATVIQLDGRPVDQPSLIIEDIFAGGVALACKSTHKLPVVAWWIMTAATLMGIQPNAGEKDPGIYEQIARGKELLTEVSETHPETVQDRLVSIPGVPPHYEWELATQDVPFMIPIMEYLIGRMKDMLKHASAIICCATLEFEPVTAAALSKAFNLTPFLIGPSVDLTAPHTPDPESPITQFLDRAYTEKGAHSVIYVAFGTLFFPPPSSNSLLMAALDEIPKAGFRFIFALSSESAQLDQSWIDGHVQAGNAIFPAWTNQTAVLEHPAVHYFLSHGGWNSSTEAIVRGVPMIFWPIAGDQPLNAVQIAGPHDCGFELLQVRTGPAKSKAYQNGADVEIVGTNEAVRGEMRRILELSKGSRGKHQRENAKLLGKVVSDSLAPGGSGDIGLEKFGEALGLVR